MQTICNNFVPYSPILLILSPLWPGMIFRKSVKKFSRHNLTVLPGKITKNSVESCELNKVRERYNEHVVKMFLCIYALFSNNKVTSTKAGK